MARIPILRFSSLETHARQLNLTSYYPVMTLPGLVHGVDNLRHDVYLSPKFCDEARAYIGALIVRFGDVADVLSSEKPELPPRQVFITQKNAPKSRQAPTGSPAEFKRVLAELLVQALNRAKREENLSIDLLAWLAVLKVLRAELAAQFSDVLERCRAVVRRSESLHSRTVQGRERISALQVRKKIILRRCGQELFEVLRETEKHTLARMRRSLFGDNPNPCYELFLNRLLFSEDGRDDYLNAEHYVMLGNYERDPDRFHTMRDITGAFLMSLDVVGRDAADQELMLDGLLSAPENAQELVAGGTPDDSTARGKAQKALLTGWLEILQSAKVMDYVVAAYEAVPLLSEYSPPINAQQLKNALVSRQERNRVEQLIQDHGKVSLESLNAATKRVANLRPVDRAKVAGRFLGDFMRYHRDLRRLEALASALDTVNVLANGKLRELSSLNHLLYEFLLPDELQRTEEIITHHVIIKADVRDSTRVTRALCERGLNPAAYFSLNFYDPVNKLLAKYGATKVFLEGDAIILALLEREGEGAFSVSRACVLAREMVQIVRAYNEESQKAGLPTLELGVGISYQNSPPMYLMDGSTRIMISEALNESDRLSSCNKQARRFMPLGAPFNVYLFKLAGKAQGAVVSGGLRQSQPVLESDFSATENEDDPPVRYNVGGIQISTLAFTKLQREISLQRYEFRIPQLWPEERMSFYSGLVPLEGGSFHRIIVREAKIAQFDGSQSTLQAWTEMPYYEVCTNAALYEFLEKASAAGAGSS